MDFIELLRKSIPEKEKFTVAEIAKRIKARDKTFDPRKYGRHTLLSLLKDYPEDVRLEEMANYSTPVYKISLMPKQKKETFSKKKQYTADRDGDYDLLNKEGKYDSLFKQFKGQNYSRVFASFYWNENEGETWDVPFEKIADFATKENWSNGRANGRFELLRNYLNYTFLRLLEQNKILYSKDGQYACFNTGLQTKRDKDILMLFSKRENGYSNTTDWIFEEVFDTYSEQLRIFGGEVPDIATYIDNPHDLVFDYSYNIEVNVEHIVGENADRLPEVLRNSPALAINAIEGAIKSLKEKIRRNYRLAIPQWRKNRIQLMLPLDISGSGKPEVALVADKDEKMKIYRIKTILPMTIAYSHARLLRKLDDDWLNDNLFG